MNTSRCPVEVPVTGQACDDLAGEYCEGYPYPYGSNTMACTCESSTLGGAAWICILYPAPSVCPDTQPSYSPETMCPMGYWDACRYGSTYCLCMSWADGSEEGIHYPWICGLATFPWKGMGM